MTPKIILPACSLFLFSVLHAQVFINKAEIEYEVKTDIQKTIPNYFGLGQLKDQLPQFKTAYYDFTFANGKSIFKFDHWSDDSRRVPVWFKEDDEESVWYCNYNKDTVEQQKSIEGSIVNVIDTLPKLQWHITNDTRVIAGFNCRKAFTVIFDSVYVFALYTDEIMIPGGPCSIHGLPGTILGMTIPRLYTSWIATKVTVNDIDLKAIKPISAKRPYDMQQLETKLKDQMKDWYTPDDPDEKRESEQRKARFLWLAML